MAASTVTPRARRAHSGRSSDPATSGRALDTATSGRAEQAAARNSVPTSERRAQTVAPELEERRQDLHVVRPAPRRTGLSRGRLVLVGPVLVILSLLAVVGAQAVLTEGQVRLTNLKAQVSAAQTKRFDLELRVAQEEQPSAIVAAARAQGMIVPTVVSEIPAVDPDPPTVSGQSTRTRSEKAKPAHSGATSHGASGHH